MIGQLLRNRRAGEAHSAWSSSTLQGPVTLEVTSSDFAGGERMPREHVGKRVGGQNLSPQLSWNTPPAGTETLLLVVEDLDSPSSKPFVHCLAQVDPTLANLPRGALSAGSTVAGVRLGRGSFGKGYKGPEPITGHGPHRCLFQLFALGPPAAAGGPDLEHLRPRAVMATIDAPVLARGRVTGLYER